MAQIKQAQARKTKRTWNWTPVRNSLKSSSTAENFIINSTWPEKIIIQPVLD